MYWMTRLIPWLIAIMLYQSNLHMLHNLFHRCVIVQGIVGHMYWMTRLIPWLIAIMLYQSNLHMLHNLFHRCVIVQGIVGHFLQMCCCGK